MWADPRGKQLWVNNDVDKTITVIDPSGYSVITTFSIPQDLIEAGGKPHDVVLDPSGRLAYVSVLGLSGDSDYVVQYNTRTFRETGRAAVGKDPHLSLTQKNDLLYVPCQNSDAVFLLHRYSMEEVDVLEVPGAHGAGMPLQGRSFYTTNLPGGGPDGLWTIDVASNGVIAHTDTPQPVPHNIALTPDGKKLYVTHSGGDSNVVSVYKIGHRQQVPEFKTTVEVGFNPFGLAYAR
jgi:DNA-binding beta-propeller fold protein YncE